MVKYLPRLRLYRLPLKYATNLYALPEPSDNPVRPGRIEYIREILCTLPLQVIQMALACKYLVLAAHVPELALCYLFRVNGHRMVKA